MRGLNMSCAARTRGSAAGTRATGPKNLVCQANLTRPDIFGDQELLDVTARLTREFEKIQSKSAEAQSLVEQYFPEEQLRATIVKLQELQKLSPEIITPERYNVIVEKLLADFDKLKDKTDGVAESLSNALTNAFSNASRAAADSFADMVVDGEFTVQQLLKSFLKLAVATSAQNLIFGPVFNGIGTEFAVSLGAKRTESAALFSENPGANPVGARHGAAFEYGRRLKFARGGVVDRPTLFGMKGGRVGEAGEAGPEAILPLTRIGQNLGVRAQGAGVEVNIIDQRGGNTERPQVSERRGPNGQRLIDITIRDTVKGLINDGSLDGSFGANFGLRRRASTR